MMGGKEKESSDQSPYNVSHQLGLAILIRQTRHDLERLIASSPYAVNLSWNDG